MTTSTNFEAIAICLAQTHGDLPLDIVRRVRDSFPTLPDRDQQVLRQRFSGATLAEVADRLPGLTVERVRSIESRALNSLLLDVFGQEG